MARIVRGPGGGAPIVFELPEAASQSFKQGQFVYLNAGSVTAAGADPAKIFGIALADASGVTGKKVPVAAITPETLVEIKYSGGTPVVGNAYGVASASGVDTLDVSETVTTRFVVLSVDTTKTLAVVAPRLASNAFQFVA